MWVCYGVPSWLQEQFGGCRGPGQGKALQGLFPVWAAGSGSLLKETIQPQGLTALCCPTQEVIGDDRTSLSHACLSCSCLEGLLASWPEDLSGVAAWGDSGRRDRRLPRQVTVVAPCCSGLAGRTPLTAACFLAHSSVCAGEG